MNTTYRRPRVRPGRTYFVTSPVEPPATIRVIRLIEDTDVDTTFRCDLTVDGITDTNVVAAVDDTDTIKEIENHA